MLLGRGTTRLGFKASSDPGDPFPVDEPLAEDDMDVVREIGPPIDIWDDGRRAREGRLAPRELCELLRDRVGVLLSEGARTVECLSI